MQYCPAKASIMCIVLHIQIPGLASMYPYPSNEAIAHLKTVGHKEEKL